MILLTAILLSAGQPGTPPDLDWMAGDWVSCKNGRIVEERWMGPANGTMVGANLTRTDRGSTFEFFRIGPGKDGVWSFHAQPGGRPPVSFRLSVSSSHRVVFEKTDHDFPQRVIYWRDGNLLAARIEGQIDGRTEGEEWRFTSNADGRLCAR